MKELDLYLKLEKCSFNVPEVEYLGMIIKLGSLVMDPVKVAGIAKWPTPLTVKDVCSFLGFANFYCHFVPHYSDTAHPLLDLTKKTHPWSWDQSCNNAFQALKLLSPPNPSFNSQTFPPPLPYPPTPQNMLLGASSGKKISTVNSEWHPCAYLSQTFGPAKCNYNIYDHELLTVIRALDAWCHYLLSSPTPVQVFTDHKNLTYSNTPITSTITKHAGYWISQSLISTSNISQGETSPPLMPYPIILIMHHPLILITRQ